MPLDVWMAFSYLIDFFQGLFMLNAEVMRVIAENDTLAGRTAESVYYLSGFLKYFSEVFRDSVNIVAANETMMHYSVGIWQKVAGNATYVFGDDDANWGIAYIWRKSYECIQSGGYCQKQASSLTYSALQFFKWLFAALSEVGRKFSSVYT